jgi:hypothetical protein
MLRAIAWRGERACRPSSSTVRRSRASATVIAIAVALVVIPFEAYAADPTPPLLDLADPAKADRIRAIVAGEMSVPLPMPRFSGDTRPEVALTPRFLYVRDSALVLPTPPWSDEGAYAAAFDLARTAWYSVQGDRIRALLVFSTFEDGGESLFYLPLANDVQGLGEGVPASVFDDTPGLALDGVAWLGNLAALEQVGDAYVEEAFVHEIAHRWCAYVKIASSSLSTDVLRGRQSMHWSYLADTANSPMEGNAWSVQSDGTWVTAFDDPPDLRFSPLDLYLMGVLAPEEVPPFRVITRWTVVDPQGATISKDTAPAHRTKDRVVLDAISTATISIDDVIAGSGPRTPPAADQVIQWPIGIVLLASGIEKTPLDELAHLEAKIDALVDRFARATGGRMTLDVHVDGAGTIPYGGFCTSVDVCHRTEADRCVSIHAQDEATCTRSCTGDDACGAGACCGTASDGSTRVCMADLALCQNQRAGPPSTMLSPPPTSSAPSDGTGGLEASTRRHGGCACITTDAVNPTAILLVGLAVWTRARRRRTIGGCRSSQSSA